MNDAEIRARVDVGDGGGFLRLGNSIKQVDKQAMFLKTRINEIKDTLARADMGFEVGDTMKLEAQLEKVQNQYNSLYATNEKTTTSVSKGWEKGTRNIGRFLFNMFAVGSVFALVAKAARSYMETNDEAQAQTELTANAMGQLLAPAMKVVLDMTQYLVIGLALLIKMFTGYDALAKVTTKNIKKASDATKDLNKQLTTMDEITNISDPMGTSALTNLQGDLDALSEFNDKIKEVQEMFEKWNVQGFVNKLKDLWNWIVKNKDMLIVLGIEIGAIFGIAKIGVWIGNIGKLIGVSGAGAAAGTGLAGLLGVLIALAAIETVAVTIEITKLLNTIEKFTGTGKVVEKIGASINKKEESRTKKVLELNDPVANKKNIDSLQKVLESTVRNIELSKEQLRDYKNSLAGLIFPGKSKEIEQRLNTEKSVADNYRNQIKALGGVPKWANGSVLTKATLGIAGEYSGATTNPEIVSPQSLMKETMIEAFSQILPMMNQAKGDVTLNVNGRELAKATYSDFEYEGNRLGKTSTVVRRVV